VNGVPHSCTSPLPWSAVCLFAPGNTQATMRAVFITWLLLIVTGVVLYSVIGLAHH
jgi:hypothetical protein